MEVLQVGEGPCNGEGSCCKEMNRALTPMSLIYSVIPVVDAYVTPLSLCKKDPVENSGQTESQLKFFDVLPATPQSFTSIQVQADAETRSPGCSSASPSCSQSCSLNRGLVNAGRCATAILSPPKSGSSSNLIEDSNSSSSTQSLHPKRGHCGICGFVFVFLAVAAITAAAIAIYIELIVKPEAIKKSNLDRNSSDLVIDPLQLPEKVRDFIVHNEKDPLPVSTEKPKPAGVPLNLSGKTQVKFSEGFLSALQKVEKVPK